MTDQQSPPATPTPGEALLLTAAQTAALLGISRASLWALHSSGRLPLPVKLGARLTRWRAGELRAWVQAGAPPRQKWMAMAKGATG